MSGIAELGRCIDNSVGLIHFKHVEDSVLAGRNNFLIALMQFSEVVNALSLTNQALEQGGMETVPLPMRALLWLTPPVLAIAIKTGFVEGSSQTAAIFLQNQIGLLCQVAGVVSSIALIYFGSSLLGGVSLGILGIGFLDRQGLLPEKMRHYIHECSPFVLATVGITSGDIFNSVMAFLNILSYGANLYFSYLVRQHDEAIRNVSEIREGQLNLSICSQIFNEAFPLSMHRDHVHYYTMPEVPDRNIEEIHQMFDRMDWNERNIGVLRAKLRQDLRYRELIGNPDQREDRELIEYATNALRSFIRSVQQRHIPSGEPRDYQRMEDYLKIIVKFLSDQSSEVVRLDALLRLAVEGGEYCGPGKFEAAESVYASLIGGQTDLPFRIKLLNCLQDKRGILMQGAYAGAGTGEFLGIDWNDLHLYNQFLNLYGSSFGIRKSGADNDTAAFIEPLLKIICSFFINAINEQFWDRYSGKIEEAIQEAVGSSQLPRPEIYDWWKSWIERQGIDQVQKDLLREELSDGWLLGQMVEIEIQDAERNVARRIINPKVIDAMLFDMGVLVRER